MNAYEAISQVPIEDDMDSLLTLDYLSGSILCEFNHFKDEIITEEAARSIESFCADHQENPIFDPETPEFDGELRQLMASLLQGSEVIKNIHSEYHAAKVDLDKALSAHSLILKKITSIKDCMRVIGETLQDNGVCDSSEDLKSIEIVLDDKFNRIDEIVISKRRDYDKRIKAMISVSDLYRTIKGTMVHKGCPVCLVKSVSHFFLPCGHTFCEQCMFKINRSKCFLCKKQIDGIKPLFFC